MADFARKIHKSCADDLYPGEQVEAAVFGQPVGSLSRSVGFQLGGVVGGAITEAARKRNGASPADDPGSGVADSIPTGDRLVFGISPQRLLVFGHSAMSGKPKGLHTSIPVAELAGVDIDRKKMTSAVTIRFVDGSAFAFEVVRGQKPERFAEAVDRFSVAA